MAEIAISPDVRLTGAERIEVTLQPVRAAVRRSATDLPDSTDTVVDASLADAGFTTLADATVALAPSSGRRDATDVAAPDLHVDVGADEDAVLLVEGSGGVFRWVYPDGREAAPTRRSTVAQPRTLVFALGDPVEAQPQRRGLLDALGDRLINPIRVRVLRFVAARGIDIAVERVERDVRPSVMLLDPATRAWRMVPVLPAPAARPDGTPPRVLLLVHGTFSSTGSSFAALSHLPDGQRFLDDAAARYDMIIGYDHRTLADDPKANALGLLAALDPLPPETRIDAVAYSRGGLVYRTFAEQLAPDRFDHGRVVFVGCTNGGTHLADPENWHRLVDLYTNAVLAGAHLFAAVSGGAVAPFVSFTIKTIGQFVQALPDVAIDAGRVPGLAAMRPDGALVTELNGPAADDGVTGRYCVIGADFEPRIAPDKGITGELARFLIDQVADRLFAGDNDLVVDTAAMSMFGGRDGRRDVARTHLIAPADAIYHTVYFASADVCRTLDQWLFDGVAPRARPIEATVAEEASPDEGAGSESEEVPMAIQPIEAAPAPGLRPREAFGTRGDSTIAVGSAPGLRHDFGLAYGVPSEGESLSFPQRRSSEDAFAPAMAAPSASPAPAPSGPPPTEPEPPASGTVACHFAAEMDQAPDIATPAPLFVTVSREEIVAQVNAAAAKTDRPVAVEAGQPIRIEVIALENCAVEGESACEIPVPGAGLRPPTLRFLVRGFAVGPARVHVEARQGPLILADFTLAPIFVDASRSKLTATQVSQVPLGSTSGGTAVLRIYEIKQQDGSLLLRYDLSSRAPNIGTVEDTELEASFSMGAFTAMLLKKLDDAYRQSDRRYDRFLKGFQDEAATATRQLIPEAIRRDLWRCRAKVNIQVISNSPYIPWEVLYLDDPDDPGGDGSFLCELSLVRWMYNTRSPSDRLPLRGDRVRYVVPDYLNARNRLPEADAERGMLTERFSGAVALPAESDALRSFLRQQAEACDLLHFACHGDARTEAVLTSSLVLAGSLDADGSVADDTLTYQTVDRNARFGADEPSGMVFINACQTGRSGEGIAGVAGFAEAFLRPQTGRGAAAFVGALWSVDDHLALTFATTFYDRLLSGQTLAEATQAARDECKRQGDFTWLAYSVYGNPEARVG